MKRRHATRAAPRRRALRLAILAALAAPWIGCRPLEAPARSAAPPSCADVWANVPEAERGYDWRRDPVATPRGNEGYARFAARLPRRGCAKAWTVLVYMAAGAPDLAAPAERDLRSMEAPSPIPGWSAASTVRADVVVQIQRPAPAGVERLHLFRTPEGGVALRSPIVEALDEGAVAPGESLRRFVSWGVERYPAEHYAVVVWGHGLGWRPAESALTAPGHLAGGDGGGIAFGERGETVLDIPALGRALAAASRERLGGRAFDVYASDACLMQSIEVAGALGGGARYVVGSEQVEEDYTGLPYRRWLPLLNGSVPPPPAAAPCAPADAGCDAAVILPALQSDGQTPGATLSTLDEPALSGDLLPALRRLSAAVTDYVREDDLRRIGLRTVLGADQGQLRGTPGFRGGTRDVGVFLDRLAAQVRREPGAAGTAGQRSVLAAVHAARTALRRTVLASSIGERYRSADYAGMAGLSLWLPRDAVEYRVRLDFFATAELYRTPAGAASFRAFLDRVFAGP